MSTSKKRLTLNKYGLTGSHKHIGINIWRFYFNAVRKSTGNDQPFFIEFEFLNSWVSQNEVVLGYQSRVNVTTDDLQYALTGTGAPAALQGEKLAVPSYVVIRIGKLGREGRQLCKYIAPSAVHFEQKNFKIETEAGWFTETGLQGAIEISEKENLEHPEYFCNSGKASWNLAYEITNESIDGYKNSSEKWFPSGLKALFEGEITYDDEKYSVIPGKSFGYVERYWNKSLPETWFHISSSNLFSIISGKPLFNSGFSVQGIFQNRVSLISTFEGTQIDFCANNSQRSYSVVWNCSQVPGTDDVNEDQLHWSVSITNKIWVIDIDLFCKINELSSRHIELPEGNRNVLSVLQGGTATGEIKLYRKLKKGIEQIEYAKIVSAFCEFGHKEDCITDM